MYKKIYMKKKKKSELKKIIKNKKKFINKILKYKKIKKN
jgi:hypothetical protein